MLSYKTLCYHCFVIEPFGIVVVYLQKRDFEKNGFEDFRHFRTRNLTQTPKRLNVLYEVFAYLVMLYIKGVGTFKKILHDSEM